MTKALLIPDVARHAKGRSIAAMVLAACLVGTSAYAENGLFELDPGRWMSSERYSDRLNKHPPKAEDVDAPAVVLPSVPDQDTAKPEATPVPPPPEVPAVKTDKDMSKSYSYSPPPMPGVNNGFSVRVMSTNDSDRPEKPKESMILQTGEEDKPQEIALPDNWKAPTKAAVTQEDDDDADTKKPLDVRMSVLPTPSAVPAPVKNSERAAPKRNQAQSKKPEKTKEQIAQEKAACDAFENLKKQQLDAIQSDRQTLKALQDAVHSLGLAKKMDFRPENGSVLMGTDDAPSLVQPREMPVPKGR